MKVLCLIVLLGLAAYSHACCSAQDQAIVLKNWESIWASEFSGRRVMVGQAVFTDIFAQAPGAKGLFNRVNVADPNSPEFRAHVIRVINSLDTSLNLLSDPGALAAQLSHLAAQHARRDGVKAGMFDVMGTAFTNVLPQVVTNFNSDAWNACFNTVAEGISGSLPA